MMNHLLNAMRAQAQLAQGGKATVRIGLVSSYDPGSYCVKVRLQPEDVETGWLPLASPWVGNGWGLFCPPTVGDSIEVQFQEGSAEAGIACQRLYSDADRPLSVASGELWLVHQSGAFFKLTNDGKGSFSDGHGASVVLNGNGTISSAGAWSHTGDLTASGTITGTTDVVGGGKSLKTHTHSDPQGGATGAPI